MTNEENNAKKHGGGPKTPEGKARSAMNATRHGLTGKAIVLSTEKAEAYQEILDDYILDFQPRCASELDLVTELSICRWRLQRIWCMEQCMFEMTIARTEREVLGEFKNANGVMRTTFAFMKLAEESPAHTNLRRYETQLTRRYQQIRNKLDSRTELPPPPDLPPALLNSGPKCETNSALSTPPTTTCETNSPPAGKTNSSETNSPVAPTAAVTACETNSTAPNDATNSPAPSARNYETNSAPHALNTPTVPRFQVFVTDPRSGQGLKRVRATVEVGPKSLAA